MKFYKLTILAITILFSVGFIANAQVAEKRQDGVLKQTKDKIEDKFEKNKNIRNEKSEEKKKEMEVRKELKASTTAQIKELRENKKEAIKDLRASSTSAFKALRNEKGEIMKKMQLNSYELRKQSVINQLNSTLKSIVELKDRVTIRINKLESEGKDISAAKAELLITNEKILKARTAIDSFVKLEIATSTTKSSDGEINIEKPRKIGDDAIKAVKDARESLRNVISKIPKMIGNNATSSINTLK